MVNNGTRHLRVFVLVSSNTPSIPQHQMDANTFDILSKTTFNNYLATLFCNTASTLFCNLEKKSGLGIVIVGEYDSESGVGMALSSTRDSSNCVTVQTARNPPDVRYFISCHEGYTS